MVTSTAIETLAKALLGPQICRDPLSRVDVRTCAFGVRCLAAISSEPIVLDIRLVSPTRSPSDAACCVLSQPTQQPDTQLQRVALAVGRGSRPDRHPVRICAAFNATDEFASGHWVELFGGNGGYAGALRLNPEYQVRAPAGGAYRL